MEVRLLSTRQIMAALVLGLVLVLSCGVSLSAGFGGRATVYSADEFCGGSPIQAQGNPPPFKARLGLEEANVKRGGVLRVRLENVGANDLSYGFAYKLAQWVHGSWRGVPGRPVFAPLLVVRAGTTSPCQSVGIPRGAEPGRYRIAKEVRRVGAKRTTQPIVVRATFRVEGR